jgi:hypothetical protein
MKKTTLIFNHEKDTKGTYRYAEEESENPVVGTLYLKKKAAGNEAPKKLRVTIEEIED